MSVFPEGYKSKLDFYQTEKAIKLVKDTFERELAKELSLLRVSAPRFLVTGTGLQDDLAGTQVPVGFKTKVADKQVEMVHSLAKWKRHTLGKYGFGEGTGICTDMDAVRKDEDVDETHSLYVDQWDWERVMSDSDRNLDFLESVVLKIYSAMERTQVRVRDEFNGLEYRLPSSIQFVHSEDLESMYPDKTSKEREDIIAKKYGAVFLIGIGYPLKSGKPHDLRAADYDDWSTPTKDGKHGLNGDIIVWDHVRNKSLELSSMGIRVGPSELEQQMVGSDYLQFHRDICMRRVPSSIGGGIGQSRLCMLLLQKAHIGEVQSSVWPDSVIEEAERKKVVLL